MLPFPHLFPEIGIAETRSVTIPPGLGLPLPPDQYGFVEVYCVEPDCDCRRVMFNVYSAKSRKHIATINHAFDVTPADDPSLPQTFLDPLNPQSQWSNGLLDLCLNVLLTPEYSARLMRHYHMVKDALRDPHHAIHGRIASVGPESDPQSADRRPLPAPRRAKGRRSVRRRREKKPHSR